MYARRTVGVKMDCTGAYKDSAQQIDNPVDMKRKGKKRTRPSGERDKTPQMPLPRNYLREWRKLRGLSQETLAFEAETTHATISRLENGKTWFTRKTISGILGMLNLNAGELFGRDPNDRYGVWEFSERLMSLPPARRRTALSILESLLNEERREE